MEDFYKKDELDNEFATLDITRLTPKERVLSMVKTPQRPGNACKFTSGFVHEDEIPKIAKWLGVSEKQVKDNLLEKKYVFGKYIHKPKIAKHSEKEHLPYGKCVFLDENESGEHVCQLAESRPLHCKLSTAEKYGLKINSWYLLNYIVDSENSQSVREWASHLESYPVIPGGQLHELVNDPDKLRKILTHQK